MERFPMKNNSFPFLKLFSKVVMIKTGNSMQNKNKKKERVNIEKQLIKCALKLLWMLHRFL